MRFFFSIPIARAGAIIALALAGLLGGGSAQAAGTFAGTSISNLASLTYSVGTVPQTTIGSSPNGSGSTLTGVVTAFLVDNKVNLTVTTTDSAPGVSVVPGANGVTLTFTLSNTGNNTQDFSLSFGQLGSGSQTVFGGSVTDNFDASGCSAVSTAGAGFVPSLAPDAQTTVFVVCSIPVTQVNGDLAALYLKATAKVAGSSGATAITYSTNAQANTAGVDNVAADGAGSDDSANAGDHSARSAFKLKTATLFVLKTTTPVCDPVNGNANPKNIPGAIVSYTITVSNNGSQTASLATITDNLPTAPATPNYVTFNPELIAGSATPSACAFTSDPGSTATAVSAGKAFKLDNGGGSTRTATVYLTSSTVDTDGGGFTAPTITINFAQALGAGGGYSAGELKVNETVAVTFQVKIN